MPQTVGTFGAFETENWSVAQVVLWDIAVFAVGAATPPVAFAIERLVVTGPVMTKVSKSKRIWKINDNMYIYCDMAHKNQNLT